jgi:uncharacterized protein YndB with AHSA1/START domain
MRAGTRGQVTVRVDAPADRVYALVSDVTRMGEWSPETSRCVWLDGATGPEPGARFKGTNARGLIRWSNKPKVVAAEPGREFAFVTGHLGQDMTKWTYTFTPAGSGGATDVTESWELLRDLPFYIRWAERYLMRVDDRPADLERAMRETLERIKAVAERDATRPGSSA